MKKKVEGSKTHIWAILVAIGALYAKNQGWISPGEASQLIAIAGFGSTFRSAMKKHGEQK